MLPQSTYPRRIALCAAVLAAACLSLDATVSHPSELVGRWARLRADHTWGDTVVLQASGTMLDASASPSDSLRWSVVRSRTAGAGLCFGRARAAKCQPYRLEGDTLIVGSLPTPTYLRRAH